MSAVQPTPQLVRRRAAELLQVIKEAIASLATKEAEKVAKRKAATEFAAMDVDSGPFANVSLPSEDDEPAGELDVTPGESATELTLCRPLLFLFAYSICIVRLLGGSIFDGPDQRLSRRNPTSRQVVQSKRTLTLPNFMK